MRYAMNDVSPTGWSRHHRMCAANQSWVATTISAAAARTHATQRTRRAVRAILRAKELEDRRRLRPHAAPENEAFGGLLDQHADAVGGARHFLRLRPAEERRRAVGVDHVVCERTRAEQAGGPQPADVA